jgi:predicted SnoaL-like aldol condensation-catalyzing enzyme
MAWQFVQNLAQPGPPNTLLADDFTSFDYFWKGNTTAFLSQKLNAPVRSVSVIRLLEDGNKVAVHSVAHAEKTTVRFGVLEFEKGKIVKH